MLRKFIRYLRRAKMFANSIDGAGSVRCLLDEMLGKEELREISIDGDAIWVRTGTPDVIVAIRALHELEYSGIRCDSPKIIVDAGANIGTSSMYFAKRYPEAKIFAFEPERGNFDLLVKNTRKMNSVVPIKAAIWGTTDRRTISKRQTGHWGYTMLDGGADSESTGQESDCITIDEFMQKFDIERIDLLKMDIEGGEKSVFENSSAWINAVDVISVELHDRICMGCDRAFYLATKDFGTFERHGEKVTAYRSD